MPAVSKAQYKYLATNEPVIFERWQKEHPVKFSDLPDRVKKKSKKK